MKNSEKLLELISAFIKNGILTSQDARKEMLTKLKFSRENLIDCLLTVRYQEKSKDGIPRFPVGVDIRYDLKAKKEDYKLNIPICDTSFHRGW